MTKNKLFAWAITLLCFSLTSCSDEKDGPSEKILVTNAGVTEANQTVKPGDIVHIYGDGFQEGDQVDFDFRWDLGEPLFPEGYLGPVSAEIVERHSNGMSIRMPYRKPESRVEIFLNRASERMSLGKVLLADGQTPKDFRLYGINETDKTIERAYAEETVTGKKTWDMSAHPDFRSVVNLQKTYGLCGLAKENGVQQPFFLDFCTGAVLGFIGAYEPFVKFAGAGASVPLLGFGNVLWKGVKEAVDKNGFLGIFLGGFKASAAGISAALIFGYLASLIFEPKMKK